MAFFGNITRRGLFRASAATAATATAVGVLSGCLHRGDDVSDPVVVDESTADNILSEDSTYSEVDLRVSEKGNWSLPAGTILRQSSGTWVPALAEGSSAIPVLNLILWLIWAFSAKRPSRRTFAGACLILTLLCAALIAAAITLYGQQILEWARQIDPQLFTKLLVEQP